MGGVYIECLSNYCKDIFPNTSSYFRNSLVREIDCSDYSEIALKEISFIPDFELHRENAFWLLFDFMYTKDNKYYGKWYELSLNYLNISTPIDLVDYMNEEIYLHIDAEKEKRSEIFSWKKGRIWVSFTKDSYFTIVLKGNALELLGAAESPTPGRTVILGKSKNAKTFERDGKTYEFSPRCPEQYKSYCDTTDFFRYTPKIGAIDQFLCYCNLVTDQAIGGKKEINLKVERERERERWICT